MQQATGGVRTQPENGAQENTGAAPKENPGSQDSRSAQWLSVSAEVTTTPKQRRDRFLAEEFAHPAVAHGNVEHMSPAEFRHMFGEATAQRHAENRNQKRNTSFDPQAYEFLKLVRQSSNNSRIITQLLQKMSSAIGQEQATGLVEVWQNFPDSEALEQLDRLKKQTEIYLQQIEASLQSVDSIKIVERTRGDLRKAHELLQAPHAHEMLKMLKTEGGGTGRQAIVDVEVRLSRQILDLKRRQIPDDERDRLKVIARLDNLKAHAASNAFCTDDILRIAVGEPGFSESSEFIDGLLRKIQKTIVKNRSKPGNPYHSYYEEFGRIITELMMATLGQTLFAFDDLRPINDWGPADISRLKEFAQGRYQMLHEVIEALADRSRNPLGTLKNEELPGLAREILYSSLYPNRRLEIRIGLGGTKQKEPLLRACAYIVPALDMIKIIQEINNAARASATHGINVPELVIVDGSSLAVTVNDFDDTTTRENGRKLVHFLHQFVRAFYSDQAPFVRSHETDASQVFGHPVFELLHQTMRELLEKRDERLMDVLPILLKQAIKYCGISEEIDLSSQATWDAVFELPSTHPIKIALDKALQYTAAHVMPEVFATISYDNATANPVLKIGGHGEHSFNLIQKVITWLLFAAPNTPSEIGFPDTFFMIEPVGEDPPYYRADSPAEISVAEAKEAIHNGDDLRSRFKGTDGPATDMQVLLKHPAVGPEKFLRFIEKCHLR